MEKSKGLVQVCTLCMSAALWAVNQTLILTKQVVRAMEDETNINSSSLQPALWDISHICMTVSHRNSTNHHVELTTIFYVASLKWFFDPNIFKLHKIMLSSIHCVQTQFSMGIHLNNAKNKTKNRPEVYWLAYMQSGVCVPFASVRFSPSCCANIQWI